MHRLLDQGDPEDRRAMGAGAGAGVVHDEVRGCPIFRNRKKVNIFCGREDVPYGRHDILAPQPEAPSGYLGREVYRDFPKTSGLLHFYRPKLPGKHAHSHDSTFHPS